MLGEMDQHDQNAEWQLPVGREGSGRVFESGCKVNRRK